MERVRVESLDGQGDGRVVVSGLPGRPTTGKEMLWGESGGVSGEERIVRACGCGHGFIAVDIVLQS